MEEVNKGFVVGEGSSKFWFATAHKAEQYQLRMDLTRSYSGYKIGDALSIIFENYDIIEKKNDQPD